MGGTPISHDIYAGRKRIIIIIERRARTASCDATMMYEETTSYLKLSLQRSDRVWSTVYIEIVEIVVND